MLAALGGLPLQMRQRGAEMDGVLTRAAADFENVSAIGEMRVQHFENRIAIAITGGSVRVFDRHAASFGRCAQSRKRQGRSAGSLRAPAIDDTRDRKNTRRTSVT